MSNPDAGQDNGQADGYPGFTLDANRRATFTAGNIHRAEPGNLRSRSHGAYSSRTVAPLAAEIEATARADTSWPQYLSDASYTPAVAAWAWSEAVVMLLRNHMAGQDLDAMLSDRHEEESTERRGKGSSTRRTTGKRVTSTLALLARWEATASGHRQRLGLDPLSRAKLGRDVTSAQVDLVQLLTQERERLTGQGPAEALPGTGTPPAPRSAPTSLPHTEKTP